MHTRYPRTHEHVSLVGDDEDDDPSESMAWTPDNDPDQLHYNRPLPDDDEEPEPPDAEPDDDADDTEDAPPSRTDVRNAAQGLVEDTRTRFRQVRTMGLPQGLRRKDVVLTIFVHGDGRVKVLR